MKLVSIKVLAEFLMVKQSTIYSWVRSGSIPFHRLNRLVRFDLDEIEAWVRSSKPDAVPSLSIEPRKSALPIDEIVRRAIDGAKAKAYNPSNGKPGRHQGLRKED